MPFIDKNKNFYYNIYRKKQKKKKKGSFIMSASPYMYLEYFNGKNWEAVAPMVPKIGSRDENPIAERADFAFPNGCHEIFSALGYEDSYSDLSDYSDNFCKLGIPDDASEYVKHEYELFEGEANATTINLADLYIAYLKKPSVRDYDREEEAYFKGDKTAVFYKENPIKEVIDKASAFMTVWNSNRWDDIVWSNLRVIGWVLY